MLFYLTSLWNVELNRMWTTRLLEEKTSPFKTLWKLSSLEGWKEGFEVNGISSFACSHKAVNSFFCRHNFVRMQRLWLFVIELRLEWKFVWWWQTWEVFPMKVVEIACEWIFCWNWCEMNESAIRVDTKSFSGSKDMKLWNESFFFYLS